MSSIFTEVVLFICSIDATVSDGLGRMVNDSKHGNSKMKKVTHEGRQHLCLFATMQINPGDELRYDYGDDPSRLFWRKQVGCRSVLPTVHNSKVHRFHVQLEFHLR